MITLGISVLFNAGLWLIAWQFSSRHNEAAVLHYNIDVGVDLIGESHQITTLPIAGTILLVVNTLLGVLIYKADTRAAWTLLNVIPVVQLILIGTMILLWRINA